MTTKNNGANKLYISKWLVIGIVCLCSNTLYSQDVLASFAGNTGKTNNASDREQGLVSQIVAPKKVPHIALSNLSDNAPSGAEKTQLSPSLLPDCPDKVPPGFVDIVAVPEEEMQGLYIVNLIPRSDPYSFKVYALDGTVVKILDDSGQVNSFVSVPAGSSSSNRYWIQGVSMGQTTIRHVSPYDYFDLPVGVWKVDGMFDFNALGDLTKTCYDAGNPTQPSSVTQKKAECGKAVKGVVSDASSRLLLRLKSGVRGEACFKVVSDLPGIDAGELDPLDSQQVTTDAYNKIHYGFTTYVPPNEFDTSYINEREVIVDFAFTPLNPYTGNYLYTNTLNVKKAIKIRRPPVLLVHGVWSSAEDAWRSGSQPYMKPEPERGWTVDTVSYSNSLAFGEASVIKVVKDGISNLVKDMRLKHSIATTQADIIAHSMGNLVTRKYMDDPTYRRDDNFLGGDIHRLIALTSPHYGSQFANLLINIHQNFPDHTGLLAPVRVLEKKFALHGGAVCALAEGSPDLDSIGPVNGVEGEAIVATGGQIGGFTGVLGAARWLFNQQEEQTHLDPYVFRVANDGIVSLESQQDGLPFSVRLGSATHAWMVPFTPYATSSAAGAQAAYAHLDEGGVFFPDLPDIATSGDGAPYPRAPGMEVGRGQAIDAANYATQCCPGCPMRRGPQPQPITVSAQMNKEPKTSPTEISPGVTVNSPADNGIFLPGDTLPVDVDVDPALQATRMLVYLGEGSERSVEPVEIQGPPFTGNVLLPSDYAGAFSFDLILFNATGEAVGIAGLTINIVPSEVPSQIEASKRTLYLHFPEVDSELERHISVFGKYLDGTQRNLTDPMLGTTYSSNNTSVATVDANGLVTPVAEGTAYITIEHKGVKTFAEVIVGDISSTSAPIDHTGSVTINTGAFRRSTKNGRFVQQVKITNSAQVPLSLPLRLVLEDLPPGVVVSSRDGETKVITPVGSPYLTLETDERGFISPGNTITVILEFLNFQGVPITYTPKVFTAINP